MPWPYGAGPGRSPARIDSWLPRGAWKLEHHAIDVAAEPAAALAAVEELRIRDVPIVRALFALRRLPFEADMTLGRFFGTPPFLHLDREQGRELVFGVGGPGGRERRSPATPAAFRAALEAGQYAAIGNFRAEPIHGGSRLWTETWVHAPRLGSRLLFTGYWLLIGPFSAWIRRIFLQAAARRLGGERRGDAR